MINEVTCLNYSFLSALADKFYIQDFNVFLINLILAAILLVVGVFLGKFIKYIVRKGIEKAGIEKSAKKNFIELFLSVVKWSIYILFISLALDQLGIPELTKWLTSALVVVPALVGSLLLIAIGFALATYLRDLIQESSIENKYVLATIFYYFVIYSFLVFALKTILIGQDKQAVNVIIVLLTAIVGTGITYWHVSKKQ